MGFLDDDLDRGMHYTKLIQRKRGISYEEARKAVTDGDYCPRCCGEGVHGTGGGDYETCDTCMGNGEKPHPALILLRQALLNTGVRVRLDDKTVEFVRYPSTYRFSPDTYKRIDAFVYGVRLAAGLECFDNDVPAALAELPVEPEAFDPQGPFAAGAWAAVKWVERRRDDYIREHGNTDPETGAVEFPDGGEYVGELDEIVEGLQTIAQGGV